MKYQSACFCFLFALAMLTTAGADIHEESVEERVTLARYLRENEVVVVTQGKEALAQYEGNTCMEKVISSLERSCDELFQDQRKHERVAIYMCQCVAPEQLSDRFRCTDSDEVKYCLDRVLSSQAASTLYFQFLAQLGSMCYFILRKRFDKDVEFLLNALVINTARQHNELNTLSQKSHDILDLTVKAAQENEKIGLEIQESQKKIQDFQSEIDNGIKIVRVQQSETMEEIGRSANQTLRFIEEEQERFEKTIGKLDNIGEKSTELNKGIERSIENEKRLAESQDDIGQNLNQIMGEQREAVVHARTNMKSLHEKTKELEKSLETASKKNKNFFIALQKIVTGIDMTLNNFQSVVFYFVCTFAVFFLTSARRTSGARLWVYLLLLTCLMVEQIGILYIASWWRLDSGDTGEELLDNQEAVKHIREVIVYIARRTFVIGGSFLLIASYVSYKDYTQISQRLIDQNNRKLEEVAMELRTIRMQNDDIKRMFSPPYGYERGMLGPPVDLSSRSLRSTKTLPYDPGNVVMAQRRRVIENGKYYEEMKARRRMRVSKKRTSTTPAPSQPSEQEND